MKRYSMKHKKKATRRMKIQKPKGGAELPPASSSSTPPVASSTPPVASSTPPVASSTDASFTQLLPDASLPDASSTDASSTSSELPWYKRMLPGANWWKNLKMPWNGGKIHKKKRSLKRNTKKRK